MTVEDRLRNYILSQYRSMLEFTEMNDIPYSTMKSVLERGVTKSSISSIIKICDALNLSVDALANGELRHFEDWPPKNNNGEPLNVYYLLEETKTKIRKQKSLVLDNKIVDIEAIEPIFDAIDVGYEMACKKIKNKNYETYKI